MPETSSFYSIVQAAHNEEGTMATSGTSSDTGISSNSVTGNAESSILGLMVSV
jgi:hypothetical protein